MLVLMRYEGQGIRIGDNVLVKVIRVVDSEDGGSPSIHLGISAPKSTRILREELWNDNQVENADATDKA